MSDEIFMIWVSIFGGIIGFLIFIVFVLIDKKYKKMTKEKKNKFIKRLTIGIYLTAWIGGIFLVIWVWITIFWFVGLIVAGGWYGLIFNPFFDWKGRYEAQMYRQQKMGEKHQRAKEINRD